MLTRILCCTVALHAGAAHALQTDQLAAVELGRLSAQLAASAGSSQWQQLWKRSRDAGHFQTSGEQPRFTLPMKLIPDLVRDTLSRADSATPQQPTLVLYRRDFAPRITGTEAQHDLTAICLRVDWRGVPDNPQPEQLAGASMLRTYPCR